MPLGRLKRSIPPAFFGFGGMTFAKVLGGLLIVKLAAIHLGPEGFGRLGQLMTAVAMVSVFAGGGITNALIQALAASDEASTRARLWGTALKIYAVEGLFVALLLVLFSRTLAELLMGSVEYQWLLWVLAGTQFFTGANNLLQGVLSVLHRVKAIVWINIAGTALGAGIFALSLLDNGYEGAALGVVLFPASTGLVGLVVALSLLPPLWRHPHWQSTRAETKRLLSYAVVVLTSVLAVPLAQMLVRHLIATHSGWGAVGYWQGVLKISDVYMQFFGMVMIYYALPRFSARTDIGALDKEFRSLRMPLFGLMLAGLATIYLLRDFVLHLLFSADFLPARAFFLPQMLGDLLRVLAMMYVYYSVSRGARLMPILYELVQAIGLLCFSYLLLSRCGDITPVYAHLLASAIAVLAMMAMHRARRVKSEAAAPSAEYEDAPRIAPKRILMVCSKFSPDPENGWLTNDLAAAFDARGHQIDVLHLDWTATKDTGVSQSIHGKVRVITVPALGLPNFMPRHARYFVKWLFSSYSAARRVKKLLPDAAYDVIIGFSPAVVTDGLVRAFSRPGQKRYMVLWDFFPRYHAELGLLPVSGPLYRFAKKLEARAIAAYDVIGCMSPGNVDYFRRYHPDYNGTVEVLPLWGPESAVDATTRASMRDKLGLKDSDVAAVFGGQLIPGRGIEHIFTLAALAQDTLPDVQFIIAGAGPLQSQIEERLQREAIRNVRYIGSLPRDEYLKLLSAGDIGLVFNSGHVSVPTFPSKSIDYFRASLPILGAVEAASDYSAIIEQVGAGYSNPPHDMARLHDKLAELARSSSLRQASGARGWEYFRAQMTAKAIACQIERMFA